MGIDKGYYNFLKWALVLSLQYGKVGELLFTIVVLVVMFSPSLAYYWMLNERWLLILSSIWTMILMMIGYKHLRKIKT